jgi:hypothetical protein
MRVDERPRSDEMIPAVTSPVKLCKLKVIIIGLRVNPPHNY